MGLFPFVVRDLSTSQLTLRTTHAYPTTFIGEGFEKTFIITHCSYTDFKIISGIKKKWGNKIPKGGEMSGEKGSEEVYVFKNNHFMVYQQLNPFLPVFLSLKYCNKKLKRISLALLGRFPPNPNQFLIFRLNTPRPQRPVPSRRIGAGIGTAPTSPFCWPLTTISMDPSIPISVDW